MDRFKGVSLIVLGAAFWGATGPLAEVLFSSTGMTVPFMLSLRLIVAGIFLLTFLLAMKKPIFLIWKSKVWARDLVIFSIIGMLGVQYSFNATIHESNAVFATLIQFLGPIFIVAYVSFNVRKWPPKSQVFGMLGTLIGLFLLLTNASFTSLLVSKEALIWGLIEGVTFAFYTLYPAKLMKEWGVFIVVGWGMLIGGVLLCFSISIWKSNEWAMLADGLTLTIFALSILFGTLGFVFFLSSLKYISPILTSVLSSIEPLTAMILSIFLFQTTLAPWQLVGALIILVSVTWLSIAGEKKEKIKTE